MTHTIRNGDTPRSEPSKQPFPANREAPPCAPRPCARGKFLYVGEEKIFIRGVTYGAFRPDEAGRDYDPEMVERDFSLMAANGVNAVRTYTVPPRWLLDAAVRHGLYVLVGIPWEQHVSFLDEPGLADTITERVADAVRECAGHPAVLAYAVGNEIPAQIVRWYGQKRIERFIERLYLAAKAQDPEALVTYVSYPSTEYLDLPFLDCCCLNVYIESRDRFEAYLARVQNLAGDRPLIVAEIGLDSASHGEHHQAETLDWQVRSSFAAGCAGVFAFSWTDEWFRGGSDVTEWAFGLTDRQRQPKPALAAVRRAFADVPFPADLPWPSISVVVCSHNGARTLRACLEGVRKLRYPSFDVLVVDDGSTDDTAEIARAYDVPVISTPHRGLSAARNTGIEAAGGEIVAYTDDDAWPDPDWLTYLAATFMTTDHVGVGGPNVPPLDADVDEECVGRAPGGPTHVLLADTEAEHIPGCNAAFRKTALQEIGGFDTQFWTAGDDVNVCWRLRERGWTLGFHPSALVWHRPRGTTRAYWRQQAGYGKAEALLERKWPEKYNGVGHATWSGRLYSNGRAGRLSWLPQRIYHGTWGSAPFQSAQPADKSAWLSLLLMPEWYIVVALLVGLSLLGIVWRPLWLFAAPAALAAVTPVALAWAQACHVRFRHPPRSRWDGARRCALVTTLHVLHPLARLKGRVDSGLTPWRERGRGGTRPPVPAAVGIWSEVWHAPEVWLTSIERDLRAYGLRVRRGDAYERWDLEAPGGMLGATRLHMAIEEHGSGKQLARFRIVPRPSVLAWLLLLFFMVLCMGAGRDDAWPAVATFGLAAIAVGARALRETMRSAAEVAQALRAPESISPEPIALGSMWAQAGLDGRRDSRTTPTDHSDRLTA